MPGNNLFGEILPNEKDVHVFHDESGNYGSSNWIFTGLLWIESDKIEELNAKLKVIRENENYMGEIHFNMFPKSFAGEFGKRVRVAREWFRIWFGKWSSKTRFNVLAINRKHKNYDHTRFGKDFHAYNKFTSMALKSGLSWFFNKVDKLNLRIFSDEKARRPKGLIGDGIFSDNFENYIKERARFDAQNSPKIPELNINDDVQCLSCTSDGPYSAEEELLQLTDILVGSIASAVEAKSRQKTKLWFGNEITKFIDDIKLKPWEQVYKLHRKFSVSFFPDDQGLVSNTTEIKIKQDSNQLSLL